MAESKNVANEPKSEPLGGPKGLDSGKVEPKGSEYKSGEQKDHQKTGDVQDRETRSTPLSKEGDQYLKNREQERKKEQEALLKLQDKWNNRNKSNENDEKLSKEDMQLFQRAAGARKRYFEIKAEVDAIPLDHEDIKEYQDLRTQAYSEYMTLFNDLVGQIKREFN